MIGRGAVRNMLARSGRPDLAPWSASGQGAPVLYPGALPAGVDSAAIITDDGAVGANHYGYQQLAVGLLKGKRYIFSAYALRVAGNNWFALGANGGATGLYANLATGAVGGGGGGVAADKAIEANALAGWYRIAYAFTADGSTSAIPYYLANADGGATYNGGSGANQVAVGGLMLEEAYPGQTTPSPYVPTGAAPLSAVGTREWRQNMLKWSKDLSNAVWQKTAGVVCTAPSADVSPPTDAPGSIVSKVVYDGSGTVGNFRVYQQAFFNASGTGETGKTYSHWIWMRVASGTKRVRIMDNFNFTTCDLTSTWQRFKVTSTWPNSSTGTYAYIFSDSADNAAFTLYVASPGWAQSNVATDPIETTSAPANSSGAPRSQAL
jgi:hypothetical protein